MRTVTNNEALHVFVMVPAELASLLSEFVCVYLIHTCHCIVSWPFRDAFSGPALSVFNKVASVTFPKVGVNVVL